MSGLPIRQGLYDPRHEHDACGIGFIANLKGKATHEMIQKGLAMLCQMEHRGALGSDPETGDGAGILLPISHDFFESASVEMGIQLPAKGRYAIGMIFLPTDEQKRSLYEKELETIIQSEGQTFLGWRSVPTDETQIGKSARESCPFIRQVFVKANDDLQDQLSFERKLYLIRKQFEKLTGPAVYVASLSSRTIVYKGLVTPRQLGRFYLDLNNPNFHSLFAVVHSRFSTNTFPTWERAHPNRYLIHNGEINTLNGNLNWMKAREQLFESAAFGADLEKVLPVIQEQGSDSAILDNVFEFLSLEGRSLPHTAMMLIPEPWEQDTQMGENKKSFYQYHSCLMEPWDGPTAIAFTDGHQIGAILDRNGLRPARYYVTNDDTIVFASEVGVLEIPEEKILKKGRLSPGKMLLVNLEEGRILSDEEVKQQVANENPYREWLNKNLIDASELSMPWSSETLDSDVLYETLDSSNLTARQKAFGYTQEEVNKMIHPLVVDGKDPIGSMGIDTPLAVLSDRPQLLYNYFKQSFAQVTNPPIDAIRESCVVSTFTLAGSEGNLLQPSQVNCRRIRFHHPILTTQDFRKLAHNPYPEFQTKLLSSIFPAVSDESLLESALRASLEGLFQEADDAIEEGCTLLVLSDRELSERHAAIPSLLALSGLHQHLVRKGTRSRVSLIVDSGEPRDVHQFSMLIGYGADLIHPYLAYATIQDLIENHSISNLSFESAVQTYIRSIVDGIVKVMSKMGISTIQSYRGAQIFEAIGISSQVIEAYFTRTSSQIEGIGLDVIAKEAMMRHEFAYSSEASEESIEPGGEFQFRRNGEYHAFNPKTVHTLQHACREGNYQMFKKYSEMANEQQLAFLRNLLEFKPYRTPIAIEEVETAESICQRFKTGAMSYGALSQEAHEALAIAMNRLGGKSNSGEGGEDPKRNIPDRNGDIRRSAIRQVASGRFGVSSSYLVQADELQIKMAQGAKPGEGGQLPGNKVYPWIAEVRGSTPGVGLISPPPHHDIYSIEDLAQLIFDLKNANSKARISVKLVSKAGVGTIAAGVAKGLADVIVISGHEGGTGASPRTSIKHAGLPWELGLSETHQTLLLNQLRDRVVLETDGKLMTGRDVVIAALLGAEEFGFATAPLVALGCAMARACHLDTCPVGVATQNPELRKRFAGDPQHVVNFMRFIAEEVRELMAQLGFRTVEELIGRTDVLQPSDRMKSHWKAKYLDLSSLLYQPDVPAEVGRFKSRAQDHRLDETLDRRTLLKICSQAVNEKTPVAAELPIRNVDRVTGAILGSEITSQYGEVGLPEDTIRLTFNGSAGQSFGAFAPRGMSFKLMGDANDYVGKGLSGGKLIVCPPAQSTLVPEENIIIGNVAFYGATAGEAYIRGQAGERFGVRNSGMMAVVEGIGDHGCEYMTGGRVVILGSVGKNFGAGMSGGIAYVLADDRNEFIRKCNPELILFEALAEQKEMNEVKSLVEKHLMHTGSLLAKKVLEQWGTEVKRFVKVIPKDYNKMLESIEQFERGGMTLAEAKMASFEETHHKSRVHKEIPKSVVKQQVS